MCLRVLPRAALHLLFHGICWFYLAAAATAADPPANAVLHLTNGGFLPGELRASDDPKVLRWCSPFFARPFAFPLGAVHAVQYAVHGPQPKPVGEYCFELVGDDTLYGDLAGLTDDDVEVDAARLGRIHLRREHVRRLYRWKGAESIYLGPNGLAGWTDSSGTSPWRDEGGQLLTDQPGATLFGDLGIPDRAVIEVELSWKRKPDFVLALGVDDREATLPHAFRLEVWGSEVVAVGESARDADVASVQQVRAGEGRLRVQAYLDQKQKRLILLARGGKPLATLHIDANKAQSYPGVRLTNGRGDVRLEHLRITRWNGLPPREVREEQARLHRTDGSIVYGRLSAFDPSSKQFTVSDGTAETRVEDDAIADVFLAPSLSVEKTAPDPAATVKRMLRVVYRDGARFSGTLTRVEDTHLTLICPGVKEPLRLPLADVRSVLVLQHGEASPAAPVAGIPGRLEMEGVSLKGRLVDASDPADAGCLVWHPDLSLNACPMLAGVSGRIVYHDPPPPPTVRNYLKTVR